ncbi:hypothetical protein Ddye_005505 [Dipteronia dyeriana]|uniref:Uncharacterized protein n=1 Tax=Dipteronia dyeriana TaxID=168575 RepID=A0AAD9XGN3_9ROSI|nr:hypothetical protein Ddye_005505 [Dipteronia dyeriana]
MKLLSVLLAFKIVEAWKAAAQLLFTVMIIYAYIVLSTSASSVLLRPWFIVLVLAEAIERLSGVALGVAM